MSARTGVRRLALLPICGFLIMADTTAPTAQPGGPGYTVRRAAAAHQALLDARDAAWAPAESIEWGPERYRTRFRALWTDSAIYVRFDSTDPNPWHTMTRKDDRLWEEEVVEIFIDPAGQGFNYFELEVNPANVVCDVRMLSAYPNVKSDLAWDHEGLETRVVPLQEGGKTIGWTATAAIPFDGFRSLPVPDRVALPPRPGDAWRFNVYRIKRPNGPANPKEGAVLEAWSKTGLPSFHHPPAFRPFTFQ